jgi:ATP-binding cassette ChvD family protein
MDALRLPPGDASVATLSGGERRRVALCRLLLEQPEMLLLDEPTNHLDAESVAWLEKYLEGFPGTVVAITHDRYFLDNVAKWILELDRGAGIPWEGNYSSWLDQKRKRLATEEKQASARQKTLERELEWVRMAPKARHAKGKARLQRYEELRQEADRQSEGSVEILIPVPERLGDEVVVAEKLSKGYGDRLALREPQLRAAPRRIVGVIGPNGAGKTTLFRMIAGQEKPDSGNLTIGKTVKLAYVDQSRDSLDGTRTVYEEISGGEDELLFGSRKVNARAYCAGFNFRGSDQQKKVKDLSGGERNRVHLAKLLKSGGNLLLLDEPTNDLDVDTLRALEDALVAFAGCAVVISHDRWFLDRIATHILAFEGESEVYWYEGNYQDYAADFKKAQRSRCQSAAPDPVQEAPPLALLTLGPMTHPSRIPYLPARIEHLADLAENLWWSWQLDARGPLPDDRRAPLASGEAQSDRACSGGWIPPGSPTARATRPSSPVTTGCWNGTASRSRATTPGSTTTTPQVDRPIAYFCAEFGLHNSVPIYSGGLGILAGDHCKAASDLGVPLVGVGLFYTKGYFDQQLRLDGWQEDSDVHFDVSLTPLERVAGPGGVPYLTVVETFGRPVHIGVWRMQVGRVPVYLLDTNLEQNDPADRDLSGKLYAGGPDMRLRQEWILGVGGVRVLRAVGLDPAAWHANEGHAAFMLVERLRELHHRGNAAEGRGARGAGPEHLHDPHSRPGGSRPLRPGGGSGLRGPDLDRVGHRPRRIHGHRRAARG